MRKIFRINGYWKDNKDEFYDLLVTDFDDCPENMDEDDFFFYGLSEREIKENIEIGNADGGTAFDFVITSYEDVTADYE